MFSTEWNKELMNIKSYTISYQRDGYKQIGTVDDIFWTLDIKYKDGSVKRSIHGSILECNSHYFDCVLEEYK